MEMVRTRIGREIKKPVEEYTQDCVLKATVMENSRRKERQRLQHQKNQANYMKLQKQVKVKEQKQVKVCTALDSGQIHDVMLSFLEIRLQLWSICRPTMLHDLV